MQEFINRGKKITGQASELCCEERPRLYLLQESLKNQHANRGHTLVTIELYSSQGHQLKTIDFNTNVRTYMSKVYQENKIYQYIF